MCKFIIHVMQVAMECLEESRMSLESTVCEMPNSLNDCS